MGKFTTTIAHKNTTTEAEFVVVENHRQIANLLSSTTSQELGLISLALATSRTGVTDNIFQGFGKIDGVKIKLHIDKDVTPITQTHRRVPFHIRKDVEKEIERLEQDDIIEKVSGPTPWISPIAAVPKKAGGVRLCVDMRAANKAIKRERHPMPTTEEIIHEMNGSTVFSRLDLKQVFHQLELDEESRYITTFSTHVGLRRYKRLMFGVNSAPEMFQHTMRELLQGIPGALNFIDDIIVYGTTKQQHDRNLKQVIQTLQSRGVKLNESKCEFGTEKLVFWDMSLEKKEKLPSQRKSNR